MAPNRIALGIGLVVGLGVGIPGIIFMYLTFRALSKRKKGKLFARLSARKLPVCFAVDVQTNQTPCLSTCFDGDGISVMGKNHKHKAVHFK